MTTLMDKIKKAAFKAGQSAQKDSRLQKAAQNVKKTVTAFQEGYRRQARPDEPETRCPECSRPLPQEARFCPRCGTKVQSG